MNKPQPQTGPEIEEYSTTATPKAYAGSVPVFCAHDAIVPLKDLRPNPKNPNQHPPEQIKLLASIIVPEPPTDDWQLTTCPVCGAECWQTDTARRILALEPDVRTACTACALKGLGK